MFPLISSKTTRIYPNGTSRESFCFLWHRTLVFFVSYMLNCCTIMYISTYQIHIEKTYCTFWRTMYGQGFSFVQFFIVLSINDFILGLWIYLHLVVEFFHHRRIQQITIFKIFHPIEILMILKYWFVLVTILCYAFSGSQSPANSKSSNDFNFWICISSLWNPNDFQRVICFSNILCYVSLVV